MKEIEVTGYIPIPSTMEFNNINSARKYSYLVYNFGEQIRVI